MKKLTQLAVAATALAALTIGTVATRAEDTTDAFRGPALASLKGKTIAYLPISLGFDLAQAWGGVVKTEAQRYGINFKAQDPNWTP